MVICVHRDSSTRCHPARGSVHHPTGALTLDSDARSTACCYLDRLTVSLCMGKPDYALLVVKWLTSIAPLSTPYSEVIDSVKVCLLPVSSTTRELTSSLLPPTTTRRRRLLKQRFREANINFLFLAISKHPNRSVADDCPVPSVPVVNFSEGVRAFFSPSALQPCSPSALQPCSLSAFQPPNPSAL